MAVSRKMRRLCTNHQRCDARLTISRDPKLPMGVRVIVPKYSADSSFRRHAEHVREQLAFCLPSVDDQSRLTDTQFPGKRLRTYLAGKVIVSVFESVDDDSLLLLRQEPKGRIEREDCIS